MTRHILRAMDKIIPIGDLATRDELSYPDWERRLQRAKRESEQGRGVSLEAYLRRRARR